MDITFKGAEGAFNFRAAAIIVHEGRILIMQDEGIPHDYLPGGRVHLHEPAEAALTRELREELGIELPPHRLVFMAESFFTLNGMRYHELCLYHLMEAPPKLLARGDAFTRIEGSEVHHFRWVDFSALAQLSFFPVFLKERIFSMPDTPEFISLDSDRPSSPGMKNSMARP
ncbi:MAG: NUDIX domain-containing protein [Clostridia bacterium]|nr:NUDIX domain-containing protein [Clostridia bacterium]